MNSLPSRKNAGTVNAMVIVAATIDVQARSTVDGLFHPVTSTSANGAQSSYFGTDWWTWSDSTVLPADAWRAGVKGSRAELRAFDGPFSLAVFPQGGAACLLDEEFAGTTLVEAQAICEATNDHSAFVYTSDYVGLPEFTPSDPIDYPKALERLREGAQLGKIVLRHPD